MSHCLYIAREVTGGPVKIGASSHLGGRIAQLQCGNSRDLRIVKAWNMPSRGDAFRVESELKSMFSEDAVLGEWFDLDVARLVDYVDWHVDGHLRARARGVL